MTESVAATELVKLGKIDHDIIDERQRKRKER